MPSTLRVDWPAQKVDVKPYRSWETIALSEITLSALGSHSGSRTSNRFINRAIVDRRNDNYSTRCDRPVHETGCRGNKAIIRISGMAWLGEAATKSPVACSQLINETIQRRPDRHLQTEPYTVHGSKPGPLCSQHATACAHVDSLMYTIYGTGRPM